MKKSSEQYRGPLAFPAYAAAGKVAELAAHGLKGRKARLAIQDYFIDVLLFGNATPFGALDAVRAASVLKIPVERKSLFKGTIRDRLVTLVLPPPQKATVNYGDKLDPAELEKRRRIMRYYQPALELFSRLTGLKAAVHLGGGSVRAPFPDDGTTAHFFANATPPGDANSRYEALLFGLCPHKDGHAVVCNGPTHGRGLVVKDEAGKPVVQALGLNFYLLVPVVSHYYQHVSDLIFAKLLAKSWEARQAALVMNDGHRRPTRRDFAATVAGWSGYVEKNFRDELAKIEETLAELQKRQAEAYRQKRIYEAMLAQFTSPAFTTALKFRPREDFAALLADQDLADMRFLDDGLHLVTKPIVIAHDGRRYQLGSFTVRLGKYGAVAVWSEAPRHPKGVPHPHIAKDGVPCYGNASDVIAKAAGELRIADLFRLMVRWLRDGYSPESAEVKIEEWPVEAQSAEAAPPATQLTSEVAS